MYEVCRTSLLSKHTHVSVLTDDDTLLFSSQMATCCFQDYSQGNPTRCNSIPKFYFIFMWSSTCFGRNTAHHQEPKTVLAASGFAYVKGCWTCSCWTLSGRGSLPESVQQLHVQQPSTYAKPQILYLTAFSNYTSSNPPRMQNQRLLVQF